MHLRDEQITDYLRKRRFLYVNIGLKAACQTTSIQNILPPSPQLRPTTLQDICQDIETMNEGIDQQRIITNSNYLSTNIVLEDDTREKRMKLLHSPKKHIILSLDVLKD
jgi:hypothetical protein